MLFAEGFVNAKVLSKKMVKLYKLSSEQLSQQDHYDFGMRAVKSVLVMAGGLKRANPALDEDVVLIRAMRDANLPKFLVDDVQLFQAIIQDLFPGVKIPEQACHRRGPAPHPAALGCARASACGTARAMLLGCSLAAASSCSSSLAAYHSPCARVWSSALQVSPVLVD